MGTFTSFCLFGTSDWLAACVTSSLDVATSTLERIIILTVLVRIVGESFGGGSARSGIVVLVAR